MPGSHAPAISKVFQRAADKPNVERREDPRFPADLSGSVTRLGGPQAPLLVSLQDISEGGVCFGTPELLDCGSFVVLKIEESTLFGQVKYCRQALRGYTAGVLVERMLMGSSGLSRLIENMLTHSY